MEPVPDIGEPLAPVSADESVFALPGVDFLFHLLVEHGEEFAVFGDRTGGPPEGIEILTVSSGGEGEEVYDDVGDDYFYTSNFSISVETEWHAHVPLSTFLRYIVPLTQEQYSLVAGLPDESLGGQDGNIQVVEALGLQTVRDPFFKVGNETYEMIK